MKQRFISRGWACKNLKRRNLQVLAVDLILFLLLVSSSIWFLNLSAAFFSVGCLNFGFSKLSLLGSEFISYITWDSSMNVIELLESLHSDDTLCIASDLACRSLLWPLAKDGLGLGDAAASLVLREDVRGTAGLRGGPTSLIVGLLQLLERAVVEAT